jgi:hypothetical protein
MATDQHGDDDILPEEEARQFLSERIGRVSIRTLRHWHQYGYGPARVRIGRRIGYRRAALVQWLNANEERPPRSRAA